MPSTTKATIIGSIVYHVPRLCQMLSNHNSNINLINVLQMSVFNIKTKCQILYTIVFQLVIHHTEYYVSLDLLMVIIH